MKKTVSLLCLLLAAMLLCVPAFAEVTEITYESRGIQIPATVVTPDGLDSYPILVMAHGHGGSRLESGVLTMVDTLAANGIATIRMDFPGCGDSTESFRDNYLSNMKADVLAAVDYVKENLNASKIALFGYSMGGRIDLELLAEGFAADAVVLLAPAADTGDLKGFFGGEEEYEAMRATAEADGYVVFTTMYGQVQELGAQLFSDLDIYADSAAAAAEVYEGPALVIWGDDDEAVSPAVSAAVAEALGAETFNATGEGHGYGFYSEDATVRTAVAEAITAFLTENLK